MKQKMDMSISFGVIIPLKEIEYGFGYTRIRSPYSIYLRETIYMGSTG